MQEEDDVKTGEALPFDMITEILSHVTNPRQIAICNCVCKTWRDELKLRKSMYFPLHVFDHLEEVKSADSIILKMVSSVYYLERLIVACPFSSLDLGSWLNANGESLQSLDLIVDNTMPFVTHNSKVNFLKMARNLQSLTLRNVAIIEPPILSSFNSLRNLEIIFGRIEGPALSNALTLLPNLTHLTLFACEGKDANLSINLSKLEQCKVDFYGGIIHRFAVSSHRLELLEVQGYQIILVKNNNLRKLSIDGLVSEVHCEQLGTVESLSMSGSHWAWTAITKVLKLATNVKHLVMKAVFSIWDHHVDPVNFFNTHTKLQTLDINDAMLSVFYRENILQNVKDYSRFQIPCLEELVIRFTGTLSSSSNVEQKICSLKFLVKHAQNLKSIEVKMPSRSSNPCMEANSLFQEIEKFRLINKMINLSISHD